MHNIKHTFYLALPRWKIYSWLALLSLASPYINKAADTTPPTVSITSPAVSNVVSGTLTVNVTASDDTAVTGVTIYMDGAQAAPIDASSPYSFSIDTKKVVNGYRTLMAIAKDAAGNFTRSAIIPVTVTNTVALKLGTGSFTPVDLGPVISANVQEAGDQFLFVNPTDGSTNLYLYYDTSSYVTDPLQIIHVNLSNNVIRLVNGPPGRGSWSIIHTNGRTYTGTSDPGYLFEYNPATGVTNTAIKLHASGTYFAGPVEQGEDDGKVWVGQYTPTGGALASYDPNTSTFVQHGIMDVGFGSGQYGYTVGQQGDFAYLGLGQLPWYLAVRNLTNLTTSFYFKGSNDLGGLIFHYKAGGLVYRRVRSDSVMEWYNLVNGTIVSIGTPSSTLYYDYTYQKKGLVRDATTFGSSYNIELNMDDGYPTSAKNQVTIRWRAVGGGAFNSASLTNGFIFRPQKVKQVYLQANSTNQLIGFTDFYGPVFSYDLTSLTTSFLGVPVFELHDGLVPPFGYSPILLSGYTSATLQYDPSTNWTLNGIVSSGSTNYNPFKQPTSFGKYHRYVQLGADGLVYMGINHLRDSIGGELAWYDPIKRTNGSNRSSFLNDDVAHMIPALGGTKMVYASYATDASTNAKIFVFDVASKTIDRTFYPVPGAVQLDKIVEIAPGIIFGAVGTDIFKADITTGSILYRTNFPKETLYLDWSAHEYDHRVTLGPDGYVWMFGSNTLYRVNPADGTYTNIVNTGGRTVNFVGNDIILAGNTNLYRIANALEATVTNGSSYITDHNYTNATSITIIDTAAASLYPSQIEVWGLVDTVTNVTVTLRNMGHYYPDDIDILLVGPRGEKVMLMSDAGEGLDLSGADMTFSALASTGLPDFLGITNTGAPFLPTDHDTTDSLPIFAPQRSNYYGSKLYTTNLTQFVGADPNGIWKLYVADDTAGDVGGITNGWSINIQTTPLTTTLPTYNLLSWSDAIVGVPGGMAALSDGRTLFCNVKVSIPGTNIVAVGDGIEDDQPAIQAALHRCPTNAYVYVPEGRYAFYTNLNMYGDYRTLRGAGTGTIFVVNYLNEVYSTNTNTLVITTNITGSFINFGSYSEQGTWRTNIVDIPVGATNTTWDSVNGLGALFPGVDGTVKFSVNDVGTNSGYAIIPDGDGSADPVHYSANGTSKSQAGDPIIRFMPRITGTNTGNQVYFWPPSPYYFPSNQTRSKYLYINSLKYSGLENFAIECNGLVSVGVQLSQGMGSWIKGVYITQPVKAHVAASYSTLCDITECVFDGAPNYGPSQGIGLHLDSHTYGFNIYDNVMRSNFPAIELYLGANGHAIMYNFFVNSQGGLAPIDNHNGHNYKNLIEGNVGYGLIQDGYFGSAEAWLLFRNWFHGNEPAFGARKIINLDKWTRKFAVVGNVLGFEGTNWESYRIQNGYNNSNTFIRRYGYPNMGNDNFSLTNYTYQSTNYSSLDLYVWSNTLEHANVEFGSIGTKTTNYNAGITNRQLVYSYYTNWNKATPPTWWTNAGKTNAVWPPIGPDVNGNTNPIPAMMRFYNIGNISAPPDPEDPPVTNTPSGPTRLFYKYLPPEYFFRKPNYE